jgi:hypothetical protein
MKVLNNTQLTSERHVIIANKQDPPNSAAMVEAERPWT